MLYCKRLHQNAYLKQCKKAIPTQSMGKPFFVYTVYTLFSVIRTVKMQHY